MNKIWQGKKIYSRFATYQLLNSVAPFFKRKAQQNIDGYRDTKRFLFSSVLSHSLDGDLAAGEQAVVRIVDADRVALEVGEDEVGTEGSRRLASLDIGVSLAFSPRDLPVFDGVVSISGDFSGACVVWEEVEVHEIFIIIVVSGVNVGEDSCSDFDFSKSVVFILELLQNETALDGILVGVNGDYAYSSCFVLPNFTALSTFSFSIGE